MKVVIYGPNLANQSLGSFIVHRDGCGAFAPRELGGLPAPGWAVDVDTKADAVVAVYADQMREGASYESCRSDLHFPDCLDDLPEGSPARFMADTIEEQVKGAQDHERIGQLASLRDVEAAQDHVRALREEMVDLAVVVARISARISAIEADLGGGE